MALWIVSSLCIGNETAGTWIVLVVNGMDLLDRRLSVLVQYNETDVLDLYCLEGNGTDAPDFSGFGWPIVCVWNGLLDAHSND